MKKYTISDIHGCNQTFQALLRQINFSPRDELYLLGDYVDRGPDSKGVIDTIWALRESGHAVHCLRGNHEQMLLFELEHSNWDYPGEPEVLQSFGIKRSSEIPKRYVDWLRQLPYYLEVDQYLLVHAGINTRAAAPFEDREFMLWARDWYPKINRDWLGKRLIVHGHTPISREDIRAQLAGIDRVPVINIDNGCVFPGQALNHLCAFELTEQRFFFQPYEDRWIP